MSALRLDAGAGELVAGGHEASAATLDGAATGAPAAIDGGYGAAYLLEIVSALSVTAGTVALVNGAVAHQVRAAAASIDDSDAAIGSGFRQLEEGFE
ncbi:hypothetical protein [Nocardioides zeae]|uniref:Uncharacterized protein n=1 Tax=Nocardioides zeae TaxID=1457234 RepID=A0AAJ1U5V4_9ACTN|nr:hypothetical protein [Nocardioides zeae]MDQ1104687.1 hypothetical protein [Nocardioides zeae]